MRKQGVMNMHNFTTQPILHGALVARVPAWLHNGQAVAWDAARQDIHPAKNRLRPARIRAAVAH